MTDDKLFNILERIAVALERIANKNTDNNPTLNSVSEKDLEQIKETNDVDLVIQENDINPILRFLTERNIQVKTFQIEEEVDEVLDNIALFMGNRYTNINRVYNLIKSKLNTGSGFRLDLKNATQEEISYSCQLCHSLYQIAFLSEYKYLKSPRFQISAKPNRIPTAINFFTGHWLERFIKTEIKNIILKFETPPKFAYLTNPQIILPNGDDFELDVLFYIENEVFWLEAKTGEYQNYVDKYSKMAKLMELDSSHSFMVLTEVNEVNCIALKKVFGMEVVNIERFSEKFENAINHLNKKKNIL